MNWRFWRRSEVVASTPEDEELKEALRRRADQMEDELRERIYQAYRSVYAREGLQQRHQDD